MLAVACQPVFQEVHPSHLGPTLGRLAVPGLSLGKWPRGLLCCCCCWGCWGCCCCRHCQGSRLAPPAAPPPAAATAPRLSAVPCGCASSHWESPQGRRRCSCRTTTSRVWSQAPWRHSPPFAISTCTTTVCVLWSRALSARNRACWSWPSQRLQELHLQENSIELLEDQALAGLSSLALLDLSRNQLGTISREALQPLASLQVLRLTENPWRCDCALHWLGAWIKEGGQRLFSTRDKKITCAEPPRLALHSLLEVSGSSLICIPPSVHVEPLELTANLGEDLRVACQASGYPQPLVTWRKVPQPREDRPQAQAQPEGGAPGLGGQAAPDTGSGMLFLTNITLAHAGKYECEAANAGGAASVPFRLLVNASRQPPPAPPPRPPGRAPRHEAGSMAFRALGLATQTAIAAAIALLALTALLLAAMICRRRRRRKKAGAQPGEGALFVNDYSDGPCTFAQLEELRDERGHEMFVIDRSKPLFAEGPPEAPTEGRPPEGPPPSLRLPPRVAYEIHC
ncbi:leucine-rich repeat-containing protein 24 isoform X2 [Marmota flaviventris]|uniref:leucine-rich repeat-containing protein 24 isoform X2 n=1 Tax=Marmota flaviventris TaxID=93162 RepID=UPI003A89CAEE